MSGRMRKRQDLNPGLWLLAACSGRPRCTRCSLCVPQTVAECVLYYYLTKKNENYKSLVRRSYRRRGKSQVRGGRGWLWGLVPGVPCGRWRGGVTVAAAGSGPLGGGWEMTLSGGVRPAPAAERSARRKTASLS